MEIDGEEERSIWFAEVYKNSTAEAVEDSPKN